MKLTNDFFSNEIFEESILEHSSDDDLENKLVNGDLNKEDNQQENQVEFVVGNTPKKNTPQKADEGDLITQLLNLSKRAEKIEAVVEENFKIIDGIFAKDETTSEGQYVSYNKIINLINEKIVASENEIKNMINEKGMELEANLKDFLGNNSNIGDSDDEDLIEKGTEKFKEELSQIEKQLKIVREKIRDFKNSPDYDQEILESFEEEKVNLLNKQDIFKNKINDIKDKNAHEIELKSITLGDLKQVIDQLRFEMKNEIAKLAPQDLANNQNWYDLKMEKFQEKMSFLKEEIEQLQNDNMIINQIKEKSNEQKVDYENNNILIQAKESEMSMWMDKIEQLKLDKDQGNDDPCLLKIVKYLEMVKCPQENINWENMSKNIDILTKGHLDIEQKKLEDINREIADKQKIKGNLDLKLKCLLMPCQKDNENNAEEQKTNLETEIQKIQNELDELNNEKQDLVM